MTHDEQKAGTPTCPYCGHEMSKVFVKISGGVWLSESTERIRRACGQVDDEQLQEPVNPDEPPLHCVVGNKGYKSGTWPKDGLFCLNCLTFTVKTRPM
jgi:hypothetical protein